ncbi:MAG: prepilin-type N-terminal cleavage/methylation domain-containing protein [Microthrixaceae bacterium]
MKALLVARRRAMNSQRGLTLMEVLLTSAISTIIAVPVLAWMITAFRTDAVVRATSTRTQLVTQITQYFPRDVASSAGVIYTSEGGAAPGVVNYDCESPQGNVAVSMRTSDGAGLVVIAAVEDEAGSVSLVRRVCAIGGPVLSSTDLGTGLRGEASTIVRAVAHKGRAFTDDEVSSVDLIVDLPSARPVVVSGSRKVGADAAGAP